MSPRPCLYALMSGALFAASALAQSDGTVQRLPDVDPALPLPELNVLRLSREDVTVPTPDAERESLLRKWLDQPIQVDFEDVPLDGALRRVLAPLEVQFLIDHQEIQDEGLNSDVPISLSLHNRPAWHALDLMLGPRQLGWYPDEGDLIVTTRERTTDKLVVRIYNLAGLVRAVRQNSPISLPPRPTGGSLALMQRIREMSAGSTAPSDWRQAAISWNEGPLLLSASPTTREISDARILGTLQSVIRGCCGGEWQLGPGDPYEEGGNCAALGHRLVVRQTSAVQEEIRQLLIAVEGALIDGALGKPAIARRALRDAGAGASLRVALDRPYSLHVQQLPLPEVLQKISIETGVEFHVLEQEINDEGLSAEPQITLDHDHVRLEALLRRMLKPQQLIAVPEHGLLTITTLERSKLRRYAVVYDLTGITTPGNPGPLMNVIRAATSGEWQQGDADPDEEGGTMRFAFGNLLIVRQTEQVHHEIQDLLQGLRSGNPHDIPLPDQATSDIPLESRVYRAPAPGALDAAAELLREVLRTERVGALGRSGDELVAETTPRGHDHIRQFFGGWESTLRRVRGYRVDEQLFLDPSPDRDQRP